MLLIHMLLISHLLNAFLQHQTFLLRVLKTFLISTAQHKKREAVIQSLVIEIAEQGASDPLLLLHDKDDFDKISEDVAEVKKKKKN